MDPIFTLPYSEFCVAQQLQRLLRSQGCSIYIPPSRQEKGVDLVVARRRGRVTRAGTIQVKASRTYSDRARTERSKRFRYYTWFNNFDLPDEADFVALVAIYPPEETRGRRTMASWWAPVILLFTHREMSRFLRHVKTRKGKRDKMFGFGFDSDAKIYQTRGDEQGRQQDYSAYLLQYRVAKLVRFLSGRSG